MSQSECSCKNKNPEMLEEGGNCICSDCKCHYYKLDLDLGETKNILQQNLRNYGVVIVGTTTILYSVYYFCCENNHLFI
jgi:hypothetical protein